jgi:hypothetical protein
MGDRFAAPVGSAVPVEVRLEGASSPVVRVDLVGLGGSVLSTGAPDGTGLFTGTLTAPAAGSEAYVFARLTQADGRLAFTAPLWVRGS